MKKNRPIRVAAWSDGSGARYWRIADPFKYLNREGFEAVVMDGPINDEAAKWADIYVLHGVVYKEGIATLRAYQKEHWKKLVIDQDDLIEVDEDNPHKRDHERLQAKAVVTRTMEVADLVTTTTSYLAKQLRKITPNVEVLPNCMDLERWDLPKQKNTSKRIRIGWAGSITHLKDIAMVVEPLKRIKAEFPQVDVIFVGDPRIRQVIGDLRAEVMLGTDFDAWPKKLHGLRLDIGLAPLQNTLFNRAKSNIKFQEYAIAQVPGIYSPTVYMSRGFDPTFGLIANNSDQWYACMRNLIISENLRKDISWHAYAFAKSKYNLSREIRHRANLYRKLVSSQLT